MRHLTIFFATLLAAIVALTSCDNSPETLFEIEVKDTHYCWADTKEVTIKYSFSVIRDTITEVNVRVNDSWVAVVSSDNGEIKLYVEENFGDTRSTKIHISAKGYKAKTVTLTQYSIPPAEVNHTLMYLFLGTSLNRYFKANLNDAKTAIENGILGNNNRVMFFRQESATKGYIGELRYIGTECLEQRIEEIDIPSSNVTHELVSQYIASMAEYAPAKRYGLICAGHGQAWLPKEVIINGCDISKSSVGYRPWMQAAGAEVTRAFGEKDGPILNIPELASAIENSQVELDYILFDACFMSNIETVYELRNLANYIIASPCEIMGKGFPYEKTLPHLFANEGNATDYTKAAESYYLYYRDEYNYSSRCGSIAVYDCAEIEALSQATKNVVASATEDYDASKLQTYEGESTHHFYDFGQWVNVVATDEAALAEFNDQLQRTIIAKYTLDSFYSAYGSYGTYKIDTSVYSGVTTSAPSKAYPNAWSKTNWYNYVWSE